MRYQALIVDDDPLARKVLHRYLESVPQVETMGNCCNALQAIDFLGKKKADLIFLDVEMPSLAGTDFVKTLQPAPKIIFTTAHPEFAAEAFDLGAIDFLIKPYSFERFLKAINRFYNGSRQEDNVSLSDFLYFRTERKTVRVPLESILYIESFKDHIVIHRHNEPDLRVKQAINAVELMLSKDRFIRIHRSFIVSVKKITAYSNNHVELGKVEIPIGRKYKGTFPGWEV
ncbi:two component transcriptional regulator, LytTR family [Salinimicrobium catena]|uniref:Two component transcriptional regulator, LytTR family n=1 Tax=Salinimicrobium catena TaxID=390640 RepID=A0A1H5N376_9FLAO|nr:LytTR family DNA-binding domain-containing protein [Salinimicrobium catena]SDL35449.1 two component transcriptional regulator, LytTR family [Salinimicrobium catena]SEE95900.1 two component transcriptional regulator, LytTR family [Salinimicrobium catena]